MGNASDLRIIASAVTALLAAWFYMLGVAHVYQAFKPTKPLIKNTILICFAAITISYGVVHGAFVAIATSSKLAIENNLDLNEDSERIFRSEFPQKPDALINFLKDFGTNWNISLFHYRNLGAAFAKVLIGIQDTHSNGKKLEAHLKRSEYTFIEETSNNAYQDFLR